jgi:hypothetical protein
METFHLEKLNDVEFKEQYFKSLNSFASLENLMWLLKELGKVSNRM